MRLRLPIRGQFRLRIQLLLPLVVRLVLVQYVRAERLSDELERRWRVRLCLPVRRRRLWIGPNWRVLHVRQRVLGANAVFLHRSLRRIFRQWHDVRTNQLRRALRRRLRSLLGGYAI